MDFSKTNGQEEEKKGPATQEEEEDNKISKVIKLKKGRIRDDFFAYVRMSLMQRFEKDNKMKGHILVSSPVDLEFEMFILALAVNLLNTLLEKRFATTIEQDTEILKQKDLPYQKRLAVEYRRESKLILQSNIKLCNVLCHVLARLQAEMNKGTAKFSKDQVKAIYMQRVEQFETEEEVFPNRLALRKYLRELILNQRRVI